MPVSKLTEKTTTNEKDRYQSLSEMNFDLSTAAYVFPDIRKGNASIGEFKEICCLETTDILQDGTEDVNVIAIYEKDRIEYYDTGRHFVV